MRTAALIFDNFLSEDKWNYIKETVSNSDYLKTEDFREWKDSFYQEILEWLKTQNTGWILNKVHNPTIDIPHEQCCICLENIVNVQTVCSHNYCYECLCENFETRKECPLCRTIITHVFAKEE